MSEEMRNDLCRRCAHIKEKKVKGSICPIYYCRKFPNGLDAVYMNESEKNCFQKKVSGPWRMPEGMYEMEEFTDRIIFGNDEYKGGKKNKSEIDRLLENI